MPWHPIRTCTTTSTCTKRSRTRPYRATVPGLFAPVCIARRPAATSAPESIHDRSDWSPLRVCALRPVAERNCIPASRREKLTPLAAKEKPQEVQRRNTGTRTPLQQGKACCPWAPRAECLSWHDPSNPFEFLRIVLNVLDRVHDEDDYDAQKERHHGSHYADDCAARP